jgi:polygalacturonase
MPAPARAALAFALASSSSALLAYALPPTSCDVVADCGAVADNSTNAAAALTACAARCTELVFPPNTAFRTGSVDLSNTVGLTLRFSENVTLTASTDPSDYPVGTALPWQGANTTQWRAVIFAQNVTDLTFTGPLSAVVDGNGWPWWANFSAGKLAHQRPKLVEILDATRLTFEGMTFQNSPFWTLHPVFSTDVIFDGVTVLAPRAVGNTDGIDPDSCRNTLIRDCFVDVGDDGISVKTDYHPTTFALVPSDNTTIVNTTVLSRNVAIGSACEGNVTNVRMLGGRIGDDEGSSPWAFKVKTHVPNGGVVANITLDGVTFGKIAPNTWQQPKGGTAIQILLEQYGEGEGEGAGARAWGVGGSGLPVPSPTVIRDLTFRNIAVKGAVHAGVFTAAAPYNLTGLVLENVTFGTLAGKAPWWSCTGVVPGTTVGDGVVPPLPAECGV